jgi:Uma2 family endonuclease
MATAPKLKMTTDEYLRWAEGREGRWELHDSTPVAMAPERNRHALTKFEIQVALRDAITKSKAPCRVYPDGATVRIDRSNAFEPDALVVCGPMPPMDDLEVPNPIIVVEVISPSTVGRDPGPKLSGYFSLPSVMHYLLLDPDRRSVTHHRRGANDALETRLYARGEIRLDPPGLAVVTEALFPPP